MRRERRRGVVVVVWSLALLAVLAIVGLASATQVRSTRSTLERVLARRVAEHSALSAVDEACACIEEALGRVARPVPGEKRDLGSLLRWSDGRPLTAPFAIAPVAARSAVTRGEVEIGDVETVSSTWQIVLDELADGTVVATEAGVLQLQVSVVVRCLQGQVRQRLTVRRYIAAAGRAAGSEGSGELTVRVLESNVAMEVDEA